MAELREIDHIYDESGNILYLRDSEARDVLENVSGKSYPEGYRIVSTMMISPHLSFGGTWQYESTSHGFEGLHKYTRVADEE